MSCSENSQQLCQDEMSYHKDLIHLPWHTSCKLKLMDIVSVRLPEICMNENVLKMKIEPSVEREDLYSWPNTFVQKYCSAVEKQEEKD